jgi:hypothetical protein
MGRVGRLGPVAALIRPAFGFWITENSSGRIVPEIEIRSGKGLGRAMGWPTACFPHKPAPRSLRGCCGLATPPDIGNGTRCGKSTDVTVMRRLFKKNEAASIGGLVNFVNSSFFRVCVPLIAVYWSRSFRKSRSRPQPPCPPAREVGTTFALNHGVSVHANGLLARIFRLLQVRHSCHQVAVEPMKCSMPWLSHSRRVGECCR